MRGIRVLTSGGGYQALNATARGVTKSLHNMFDDMETIGFEDGYKGLMYADCQITKSSGFSGIFTQGGTIFGTSRQPSKFIRTPDENGLDEVETMKHTYKELKLSRLMMPDGDGSQKMANMLSEEGLNVVSLPKTIDNDLWGVDTTFGFQNVVDVAIDTIDRTHIVAASHGCISIMEVMGHKVGWPILYAGLAGGADIIPLLEIPYNIGVVRDTLIKRSKAGKRFSILAVAESAISREDAKMSRKELKEKKKSGVVYPSMAYEIEAGIQEVIDSEVRVIVPGHMQHGGESCAYGRVPATRPGAAAARLIVEEWYGYTVAVKDNDITQASPFEVVGRLKTVDPKCSMIKGTRMMGISFGNK